MFEIEIRDGLLHIGGYVNAVGRDSKPIFSKKRGRCVEQVTPGAFSSSLADGHEVFMKLNHEKVIATTADGSLELREDNIGLKAQATVSDEEVITMAEKGLLKAWSFGFEAIDDDMEERSGQLPRRHLNRIKLNEVSVLSKSPAYEGTLVELRDGDACETGDTDGTADEPAKEEPAKDEPEQDEPEQDETASKLAEIRTFIALEEIGELIRQGEAEYRAYRDREEAQAFIDAAEAQQWIDEQEEEERYNHYHNPQNGQFASGKGGGEGLRYSFGKGKGSEIVGASSAWSAPKQEKSYDDYENEIQSLKDKLAYVDIEEVGGIKQQIKDLYMERARKKKTNSKLAEEAKDARENQRKQIQKERAEYEKNQNNDNWGWSWGAFGNSTAAHRERKALDSWAALQTKGKYGRRADGTETRDQEEYRYNKNHDSKGRFASGNSSKGIDNAKPELYAEIRTFIALEEIGELIRQGEAEYRAYRDREEAQAFIDAAEAQQWIDEREEEERYNHYHNPTNGQFASGKGGGEGLRYSFGKGKGSEIVGASSKLDPHVSLARMNVSDDIKNFSDRELNGYVGYLEGRIETELQSERKIKEMQKDLEDWVKNSEKLEKVENIAVKHGYKPLAVFLSDAEYDANDRKYKRAFLEVFTADEKARYDELERKYSGRTNQLYSSKEIDTSRYRKAADIYSNKLKETNNEIIRRNNYGRRADGTETRDQEEYRYNKNHDSKGRFASGNSSKGIDNAKPELYAEIRTFIALEEIGELIRQGEAEYRAYRDREEAQAFIDAAEAQQWIDEQEEEERYNHYHNPTNGQFASGAGGGVGLYYSMGKGKGAIVGESSRYYNEGEIKQAGQMYGMKDVSGRTSGYLRNALNGQEPLWRLEGYLKQLKREQAKDKRQQEKFGKTDWSDKWNEYKKAEIKLVRDVYKKLSNGQQSFW